LRSFSSPSTRSAIDPAIRSTPSSRAVERLGARPQVVAGAEDRPLLRQDDQLGALGRGRADVPVRAGEVGVDVVCRVDLDRGGAH
jgi:hypothetical protein